METIARESRILLFLGRWWARFCRGNLAQVSPLDVGFSDSALPAFRVQSLLGLWHFNI